MNHKAFAVLALLCTLAAGCTLRPTSDPGTAATPAGDPSTGQAAPAWIDTHTHASTHIVSLDETGGSYEDMTYCLSDACIAAITTVMDEVGASHAMLMPPPAPAGAGDAQYEADLAAAAQEHSDRFFYVGGGSLLNAMIHQAARAGNVPQARQDKFEEEAQAIVDSGAVAFGEMSILHLSASPSHAFEEVAADHAFFLVLADVAARNDVPIDVHMDPVLEDMPTPAEFLERSPQNPDTLQGNIDAFETLLVHNRGARIVWAHTADTTGDLSVELLQRLLADHPNLYLALRLARARGPLTGGRDNILDESGNILGDWLALVEAYPDRFIIGSDTFWGEGEAGPSQALVNSFLAQLPEDVAGMIACHNAVAIYRLDVTCP